jgi:hypothetical protein
MLTEDDLLHIAERWRPSRGLATSFRFESDFEAQR